MVKYIILFCSMMFLVSCKPDVPSNVISSYSVDMDGDGVPEHITYYHKNGAKDSIYLAIERLNHDRWGAVFNEMVDGSILGFLSLDGGLKAVVLVTPPQGSGGFTGYKVIGGYFLTTIYERVGVYQGSFGLDSNKIVEESGDPLPTDADCCPSYTLRRVIELKDRDNRHWDPVNVIETRRKN